jgi:hypothetical protein
MVKRLCALGLTGAFLVLLLVAPSSEVLAQSATATPTFTPIATVARYTTTGYTLPSGSTLTVENRATMGETILIIVGICIIAVMGIRFIYQLAVEWGR